MLTTPAVTVTPDSNIRVDGKPLPQPERARLWRYHKPAGLVTTHRDEKGRPTVFAALPAGLPRLISIGRLDLSSEGLLLLTNDGALARRLELPATGWVRRYKVRVHGDVEPGRLAALAGGITVDRVSYGRRDERREFSRSRCVLRRWLRGLARRRHRSHSRVLQNWSVSPRRADPAEVSGGGPAQRPRAGVVGDTVMALQLRACGPVKV